MDDWKARLKPRLASGGEAFQPGEGLWRLHIPAGSNRQYRLAQLDDYTLLPRKALPWQPPLRLSLRGRVSAPDLPGTWGFGLWNDPFSLSLGLGGASRRLPALPNAAWFFYASSPNYLSLRDDLPAQGFLAATFASPALPALLLGLGSPSLLLTLFPSGARLVRGLARKIIRQGATRLSVDATAWHAYTLVWEQERVLFLVDGEVVLETPVSPRAPLGLVLWIDNQYAALPPEGRLTFGTLPTDQPAWLELDCLEMGSA